MGREDIGEDGMKWAIGETDKMNKNEYRMRQGVIRVWAECLNLRMAARDMRGTVLCAVSLVHTLLSEWRVALSSSEFL